MKAERESFVPARRSTLANTSDDSVIEVFSFILLIYYYLSVGVECRYGIPLMTALFRKISIECNICEVQHGPSKTTVSA